MNASVTYPALQRRLISQRRSRAFFSSRITQHVRAVSWPVELARAAVALAGIAAWGLAIFLFAA